MTFLGSLGVKLEVLAMKLFADYQGFLTPEVAKDKWEPLSESEKRKWFRVAINSEGNVQTYVGLEPESLVCTHGSHSEVEPESLVCTHEDDSEIELVSIKEFLNYRNPEPKVKMTSGQRGHLGRIATRNCESHDHDFKKHTGENGVTLYPLQCIQNSYKLYVDYNRN